MSVNNVVEMDFVRSEKNKATSEKVSKLAFIHNQINILEDNLTTLEQEFKKAFSKRSYFEMGYLSRQIYDHCIKLSGFRKYEQLVINDKYIF